MDTFADITDIEQLQTAVDEARAAAAPLRERHAAGETLTAQERAELQGHVEQYEAARARIAEVQAADAAAQAEQDDLFGRLEVTPEEPAAEETAPEAPAEEPAAPEAVAPEAAPEGEPVPVPAPVDIAAALREFAAIVNAAGSDSEGLTASGGVPRRRPVPRPEGVSAEGRGSVVTQGAQTAITASANIGGVGVGTALDLDGVAELVGVRGLSYGEPNGSAKDQSKKAQFARLKAAPKDPVAKIKITRDEAFTLTGDPEVDESRISAAIDPRKVVNFAGQEVGLAAAGGWCAPSEILYGIPVVGEDASVGLWSGPEMDASRGGIKSTLGPDFATIYAAIGFEQTEAEAIAGDTKDCYEVTCPTFTETRMDVKGVCIQVPILTEAGYPEYVDRITSGAVAVHAHKMNYYKLAAIEAGSTAKTALDLSSTAESMLHSLELHAQYIRQNFAMSDSEILEVVLPFWVKSFMREDLALRMTGDPFKPITDTVLDLHFAVRGLAVQWVRDWQAMGDPVVATVPTTYKALIYPAGSWLALTKSVISLSTVYDSAGLAVNTYTGTFSEEGIGVRKMKGNSGSTLVVTMPTMCSRGRLGAANITCG